MKKILQGALLPFAIFASGLILLGCDQANQSTSSNEQAETAQSVEQSNGQSENDSENQTETTPLKQGSMFYIIRDVADLQLSTSEYTEKLKQTQSDLQQAVNIQNHEQLQQAATQLEQQLKDFDTALNSIQLKTQEISDIRQKILDANQQVLNSPFLNGQVDISKIDFQKIEQQMGNIQGEMLKLATMLITQSGEQEKANASESE